MISYFVVIAIGVVLGGALAGTLWWRAAKHYVEFHSRITAPKPPVFPVTPPEGPKLPSAKEIANELAKKFPAPQLQGAGNLKERTLKLIQEINDQMETRKLMAQNNPDPRTGALILSNGFRRFVPAIQDIHDEFAQLHRRKEYLDGFLELEQREKQSGEESTQMLLQLQRQGAQVPPNFVPSPHIISLMEMHEVMADLTSIANDLKD